MTPKQKDLARRFVACKHWRWMPGMRCTHRWTGGIRVLADENGEQSESYVVVPGARGNAVMAVGECGIMGSFPGVGSPYPLLPDLTDPATLGCILALVRRAYDKSDVYVTPYRRPFGPEQWICWRLKNDTSSAVGRGSSEAEALLLALEAA